MIGPLAPLGRLYGSVMRLRRAAYRTGLRRARPNPVPVIVVGNLLVGGTGKTPLVIALTEQLGLRGWRVGVASRGYRRATRAPQWVEADSPAESVGDEALLIRRRCRVPVRVDVDRPRAVAELHRRGCDLVISDDGFQHLRLDRTVNILVFDERGLGNRRCLPAGPLREPPQAMADATLLVGNQIPATDLPDLPGVPRFSYRLVAEPLRTLDGVESGLQLADLAGQHVHAFAGIARPERFFTLLTTAGLRLTRHPFPDHHPWRTEDFARIKPDDTLLMTEKDAVKCRGAVPRGRVLVLPVSAELPPGFIDHLNLRLRQ